jgi:hypothetical protein
VLLGIVLLGLLPIFLLVLSSLTDNGSVSIAGS